MKNVSFLCGLLSVVLLFSSCTEDETVNRLKLGYYLVFGTYYGECAENCVNIYYLRPGEQHLSVASEPQYPDYKANGFPYGLHFVTLSQQQYKLTKDLINQVPENLLIETALVIGEPDATDQGGVYVEINHRNMMHKYYIDTNKDAIPAYLHDFVDEILNTVAALREDES
ncbi:hypothetical protein [Catalinimonas niigatensis]|uniref:hypothetical protein n=1 Tax=Catalinimonas niigatensis TaxID=1397264 RepID=UPI002665E1E9|nr:hypothetical protein [Catalinimonas niigatensis]WPP49046.1 hypothetical protein PZB72_20475 [Catalinimonas niigatensis]